MKREGRQHGMVRTNPIPSPPWNPRPNSRTPNQLGSPPTAGLFHKVPSKPTNHSKFTGKCGRSKCRGCHDHPVCKSKDKVKGAQKLKSSSDVESNHRLITWRVVDARPGLKFSGSSASGILDYLASDEYMGQDYGSDDGDQSIHDDLQIYKYEISSRVLEIEEVGQCDDGDYGNNVVVDDDDKMSFCEVGFVWQPMDGDDSWYLVEEM